jgi:hypothetical protein
LQFRYTPFTYLDWACSMQQIRYAPRSGHLQQLDLHQGGLQSVRKSRRAKMRVFRTTVAIAFAAATLAGCRGSQFPEDVVPELASDAQSLVLEVQNHNWADIIIYVVHDGRRTRLNSVTATKNSSLIIPPNLIGQVGNLQLIARRVGAYDRYVSPQISVRTGSTIVLTLESDLSRSSVAVW